MALINRLWLLLLAICVAGCTPTPTPPPVADVSNAYLPEKGRTIAPFPHVVFCMKYPGEYRERNGGSVVAMTEKNRAMIEGVNSAINSAILSREDAGTAATWDINPPAGDCNDYAVSKRSELIDGGLPSRAVRLAVGYTPQGVGHTVVVVRTTIGDLVLDNRNYDVKRWDKTDLAWLKVESSADPKVWDSL